MAWGGSVGNMGSGAMNSFTGGSTSGAAIGTLAGGWGPGSAIGGRIGKAKNWDEKVGLSNNKAKEARGDFEGSLGREYEYGQGVSQRMANNAKSYQSARDKVLGDYEIRRNQARDEVESQGRDATKTYSETIKPRLYGIMEDAQRNANDAMSLREAGDVNNSIQQAYRKSYEDQALGEGRQGLADVGVMQALGAQAFGNQVGNGMPITGGQMTALMGANQGAAGRAFANTQQRIQSLRDQGRIAAQNASDAQYERGLAAKDRYRGSIGDIEGAEKRYFDTMGGFRGEKLGYDREAANTGLNKAAQDMGFANEKEMRDYAQMQQYEGQKRGLSAADIAAANAQQAGKLGAIGAGLGTAGGIFGGMVGGPSGAQYGSQAGGAVGGMGSAYAAQPQGVPQQPYRQY